MFVSISTLIPVFGIIFLGVVVERLRFMPDNMAVSLNQFVYWIGLPTLLFSKLATMNRDEVSSALVYGILLSAVLAYFISHAFASKGFRVHRAESSVFSLLATFPNAAFMGFPIVALLLPDTPNAAVVGSLSAALYTFVIVTAGTKLELYSNKSESYRQTLRFLFKSLYTNPFLIASGAGAIFAFFRIHLPDFIMQMPIMLGATASPVALFGMGMILQAQLSSSQGFTRGWLKKQLPCHFIKFVIFPVLTYMFLSFFGVSGYVLGVATLLSAMPTGVAAYVVAAKYKVEAEETSLFILMSTAFSAITLPITIMILQALKAF